MFSLVFKHLWIIKQFMLHSLLYYANSQWQGQRESGRERYMSQFIYSNCRSNMMKSGKQPDDECKSMPNSRRLPNLLTTAMLHAAAARTKFQVWCPMVVTPAQGEWHVGTALMRVWKACNPSIRTERSDSKWQLRFLQWICPEFYPGFHNSKPLRGLQSDPWISPPAAATCATTSTTGRHRHHNHNSSGIKKEGKSSRNDINNQTPQYLHMCTAVQIQQLCKKEGKNHKPAWMEQCHRKLFSRLTKNRVKPLNRHIMIDTHI